MNVLVDTSVWVAHFRKANVELETLLASNQVLGHPLVLAEIACGTPPSPREQVLGDLALLKQAHSASLAEIMVFIENEQLYGLGCGFVDIALLASACITPNAKLWTHDKQLMQLAKRMNLDFKLPVH